MGTYPNRRYGCQGNFWQDSTQTKAKPDHPCEDCEKSDDGHEVSRDKIGHPFDWRAAGLTFTDNFNDFVEPERKRDQSVRHSLWGYTGYSHVLPIKARNLDVNGASLVDRSEEDLVSWTLLDRFGLSRQRAFVEEGFPKRDDTIGRRRGSLAHKYYVTNLQN
jgi:hypothetical protein